MSDEVVLGTGVDLVETGRMRELIERWGSAFKDRVFLPAEQAYCDGKAAGILHYAGRFAVKEAVSKAFGTGLGPHLGWRDIEVGRDDQSGAPHVILSAKGKAFADQCGVSRILISLSHTRRYAMAQALIVGGTRE